MSLLSQLPKIVKSKKKRLGRGFGSGVGAKSTRGTTRHQKGREKISAWFEGGQGRIIKKYPLLRGKNRNKPVGEKLTNINLDNLNIYKNGEIVTIATLIEKKILTAESASFGVKLLSRGNVSVPLKVRLPMSKTAREKIEKAGGTII